MTRWFLAAYATAQFPNVSMAPADPFDHIRALSSASADASERQVSKPVAAPVMGPARPKRRLRYSGKNPRHFTEKYKEHDPLRYSEAITKVLASGKTPAGTHRPIMVHEIVSALNPRPGQTMVDATLGYGGHSAELLTRLVPGGRLLGMDVDPIELPKAEARLRARGFNADTLQVRHGNFAGLSACLARLGWDTADGVLADLGVSSMQLDDPSRGFTFKVDGPLDLRLNPTRGISAATWLARVSPEKLARALGENSDEPQAELLARGLLATRAAAPWTRTVQLADGIRGILAPTGAPPDRATADDVVRRVFQALRIEVNEEFSALETFFRGLPDCLKSGGRVAILTFHSGEDRRVKHAFKAGWRGGIWSDIADEVIRPTAEEIRSNPRAASAKLRWAVRS